MRLAAVLAACVAAQAAQAGCGGDPAPCQVAGGEYHLALPADPRGAPMVFFLHGAGGHGGNVTENAALVASFTTRGYALVAPSALPRQDGRPGGVWNFFPGWQGRDEPAFLAAVRADAAARFGLDAGTALLSGFSAGAFMVTYLACATPDAFPAYAPLAGGFWRPHPEACAGPVRLFQTHGWRDPTVPLEGRPLRGGTFLQGDIFEGMQIWRQANACADPLPDAFTETGPFWRRSWSDCAPGSALDFALHPGGHSIPEGWADMVLDWFEALPAN